MTMRQRRRLVRGAAQPTTRAGRSTTSTTGGATGRGSPSGSRARHLHRAALDQADRGRGRLDPRDRPRDDHRHRAGAVPRAAGRLGTAADPSHGPAVAFMRARPLPGARRPRHATTTIVRIRHRAAPRRRSSRRRWSRSTGGGHAPIGRDPVLRQPAHPRLRRSDSGGRDDRAATERPGALGRRRRAGPPARSIGMADRRRRRPAGVRRLRRRRPDDRAPAIGADHPRPPVEGPDPVPEPARTGSSPSTAAATADPTGRPIPAAYHDDRMTRDIARRHGRDGHAARAARRPVLRRRLAGGPARGRGAGARRGHRGLRRRRAATSRRRIPWWADDRGRGGAADLRGLGQGQPARLAARLRRLARGSSSSRSPPNRIRPSSIEDAVALGARRRRRGDDRGGGRGLPVRP